MEMTDMLRWVRLTAEITVVVAAVVMVLLAMLSLIAGGKPADSSTWRIGVKPMTVLGGSMEPAIRVGSLTLIGRADPTKIAVGDIVTFRTPPEARVGSLGSDTITTHRVVGIESGQDGLAFETKGDANEDPDGWSVPAASIVGKPLLTIPFLGYAARWASSGAGFVLLIIVPGLLLIVTELLKLRRPGTDVTIDVAAEGSERP